MDMDTQGQREEATTTNRQCRSASKMSGDGEGVRDAPTPEETDLDEGTATPAMPKAAREVEAPPERRSAPGRSPLRGAQSRTAELLAAVAAVREAQSRSADEGTATPRTRTNTIPYGTEANAAG